jgi:hypothetical protein
LRGGRDGFGLRDFHGRCDGGANTLTLIEDTNENIIGGFTQLEWESREWSGKTGNVSNDSKADPTLKSFIFTQKNPHSVPARMFSLNSEMKDAGIFCCFDNGPFFGYDSRSGNDIGIRCKCNVCTDSWTSLGSSYINDTGSDWKTFFAGSLYFQVNEIEVLEVTNSKTLPLNPAF